MIIRYIVGLCLRVLPQPCATIPTFKQYPVALAFSEFLHRKWYNILRSHTVAYLGRGMRPWPPLRKVRKHILLKMGFQTYIFCSTSAFKMQKMPFQRPKFQKTGHPYNCVVIMASPSLKSWPHHWSRIAAMKYQLSA